MTDANRHIQGLYYELLKSIDEDAKYSSLKLLQWLCFTMRPLTTQEVLNVLVIDSTSEFRSLEELYNEKKSLEDPQTLELRIISLSCGLAEVSRHGQQEVVQFIHQSVPDYLVQGQGLRVFNSEWCTSSRIESDAHYRISRSCIRYIALFTQTEITETVENCCVIDRYGQTQITKAIFLEYATRYWTEHARTAELAEVNLSSADIPMFFSFFSVS